MSATVVRQSYLTSGAGQVGLATVGDGPTLVVLAGPTRAAAVVAEELHRLLPGRRVLAVEPPGVGGSARLRFTGLDDAAAAIAAALSFLAAEDTDLAATELAAVLVPAVRAALRPATTTLVAPDDALGWARTAASPPPLTARADGTHLAALWSFLRDRRLDRPDEPSLPVTSGPPPPEVAEVDRSFRAAVTDPEAFARFWESACRALPALLKDGSDDPPRVASTAELARLLPPRHDARPGPPVPRPSPATGTELWHEYLDTPVGRAHLRRAGVAGRPVLVLPTGGGSSAQFAPVLRGLAETRCAVAVDYFGNGLSEPLERVPDAATLAREAFAVADALGWDDFDVWGSHTGACVALEMAITAPERVGRAVLEAPVMVAPEFRDDVLANYFPRFTADRFGLHLLHVWNWRRDMFRYWPWYRVDHEAARAIGMPSAEDLQLYAVGILESGTTYDLAYRAGFGYDTRARLPELRRPAILTAGPHDMLGNALRDAAALVPDDLLRIVATPATVWWPDPEPDAAQRTMRLYREFLG